MAEKKKFDISAQDPLTIESKEEYSRVYQQLEANYDSMSEEERLETVSALERAARRFTAEAAEQAKLEEERALQERPLAATGEPPAEEQQHGVMMASPDVNAVRGQFMTNALVRQAEGAKQAGQRFGIFLKNLAGQPTEHDELVLARMRSEHLEQQADFRRQMELDARAVGSSPTALRVLEETTGIAALAVPLGLATAPLRTSLARVAAEGGVGALAGAVQPAATEREFVTNMFLGGALGTGVSGVIYGGAFLPNLTRSTLETGRTGMLPHMMRADPNINKIGLMSEESRKAQELAMLWDPRLQDEMLTAGMITKNPTIIGMEGAVAGGQSSVKQAKHRRLEDIFIDHIDKNIKQLNPDNVPLSTIVSRTRTQMDKHRTALVNAKNREWQESMENVVNASGGRVVRDGRNTRYVGDKPILAADTFQKTLHSKFRNAIENSDFAGPEAERAVAKFYKRWSERVDPKTGNMRPSDVQQLMVELQAEIGGKGPYFSPMGPDRSKMWAGDLKDAVMDDLARTATQPRVRGRVANELMDMRTKYREAGQAIRDFDEGALWKMLNHVGQGENTWYGRIKNLPADELKDFMKLADEAQPGFANAARGRVLADTIENHRLRTSEVETAALRYDLSGILHDLVGGKGGVSKFEALFPAGRVPEGHTVKDVVKGVEVLDRLALGRASLGADEASHVAKMREVSINVISQDQGFFARMLMGDFTNIQLEKLLFSKHGIENLIELGRFKDAGGKMVVKRVGQGAGYTTFTQAMSNFAAHANALAAEEERFKQAEEEREALMREIAAMERPE